MKFVETELLERAFFLPPQSSIGLIDLAKTFDCIPHNFRISKVTRQLRSCTPLRTNEKRREKYKKQKRDGREPTE